MKIKSICIFCASAAGKQGIYKQTAYQVGKAIAARGQQLIYGGGKVGLMGAVADGALNAGGQVIGIIPKFMQPHEIAHTGVTELITVESMHERKLMMHEMSDGVITLPGGFGTFEELFEILTWIQLGLYQKPVGILNVNGYYDHLEKQLDVMVTEGLLRASHRPLLYFSTSLEELFEHMENYTPTKSIFELKKDQT